MALGFGEVQTAAATGTANPTFTLAAGSAVGDLLILFHSNDFYTTANLTTPTGTAASTWTLQNTYDGGTNAGHCKLWTAPVTTAGAQTVITNSTTTDEERGWALFRITGGATYDTSDKTAGATSTTWVAPSINAATADEFLLVQWSNATSSGEVNLSGYPASPFVAATERDAPGFLTYGAGYQPITASGATGTKSVTASITKPYVGFSALVQGASTPVTKGNEHILNRARLIRANYW